MNDCIDRPDTRLHPTNASEAQFATCNAGAIHTGQVRLWPYFVTPNCRRAQDLTFGGAPVPVIQKVLPTSRKRTLPAR